MWKAAALWEVECNAPLYFSATSGMERYNSGVASVRRNGFMGQILWWDNINLRSRTNFANISDRQQMLHALAVMGDTTYEMLIKQYCLASVGDAGVQGRTALETQSVGL